MRHLPKNEIRRSGRLAAVRPLVVALLLAILSLPASEALAQTVPTEFEGSTALGLALRKLGTTKRVLMIAAHPDDEATQLLSTLALGQGADVAYLSLTRGEGGQNGIGPELREGLGLLRSEELLAARRLDGAQQYFARSVDWGFSKNADEAFGHWPEEELLRDVVAVVRHFRPDILVSVFSGTPADGHGQHQVAGIIAERAFDAAADGARFPDHTEAGLRPHAPIHLFRLVRGVADEPAARVVTGDLDPLLGRSHFQVAMASRSRHRSQDMGRPEVPGPQSTPVSLARTRGNASVDHLFAGVDTTLTAHLRSAGSPPGPVGEGDLLPGLITRYEANLADMRSSFNPLQPDRALYFLVEAARYLDRAIAIVADESDAYLGVRFLLAREREKLTDGLIRAGRLVVDAIAEEETVVPGQEFELTMRAWNGSGEPIELSRLEPVLPSGWTASPRDRAPESLAAGTMATRTFDIRVAADAISTEPYFLRIPRDGALYVWPPQIGPVGIPFERDPVQAVAEVRIRGVAATIQVPATYLGVDRRSGEFRRPIRVVPPVSLTVEPGLAVVPLARGGEPLRLTVRIQAAEPGGITGSLGLTAPAGWSVEPDALTLSFDGPGEERVVEFNVRPPAGVGPGRVSLPLRFRDSRGRTFDRGYRLVDYPHIEPRPIYRAASVDVEVIDVRVPAELNVGYVAAPGDDVPRAIEQLGLAVNLLGPDDLAAAPLDPFDVIVLGIRAYEGRPDLFTHNQRLLEYVRGGGTMIVQYNQYGYTTPGIAPYPLDIARPHDRVTDHEAEVRFLDPDHQLLSWPNRIDPVDFEGWVQERGLYFLNTWDDRYVPLLEMADPGEEPNRGSLVVTQYGEGRYVYTGLALFRQFPAGVPGAYRLLANLVALGADR
jgi:LmbE family N-acetylglucosaminyl deacetylase